MTSEELRKLLELAANAVGMHVVSAHDTKGLEIEGLGRLWAPHINQDDAKRLAHLLMLDVQHGKNFVRVSGVVPWVPLNKVTATVTMDNPEKHRMDAERLAVVTVAADIGNKMGDFFN